MIPRFFNLALFVLLVGGHANAHESDSTARWWKGNLHTHSFWSDGHEFPEMIGLQYKNSGYHFLALSDHNVLSRGYKTVTIDRTEDPEDWAAYTAYLKQFGPEWVESNTLDRGRVEVRLKPISEYRAMVEESGRFLFIEAEEITDGAENGKSIHMNATNLGELIPPPGGANVESVIRRSLELVREQEKRLQRPIMFHVNHINYKWGVSVEDLARVVNNQFFEVWNGVETDNDPGDSDHSSTDVKWDMANAIRLSEYNAPPLFGLATDDTHDYHGTRTRALGGRAWVQVKAPFLSPEHIIRAMRKGEFYASTGVELEAVSFSHGELNLHIQQVGGEVYKTEIIALIRGEESAGGQVVKVIEGTDVSYRMTGNEWYIRARITSDGVPDVPSREFPTKRAWTQPVGWEELIN
jgi:hypothetical protein